MNKILVIGNESVGKTTFLNNFYKVLLKMGANEWAKEQVGENPNDFIAIVEFGAKKICINTAGDQVKFMENAVKQSAKDNCDILLSACRTDVYGKKTFPDEDEWECLYAKQGDSKFCLMTLFDNNN
jgi:GTPase SAR1 family protein